MTDLAEVRKRLRTWLGFFDKLGRLTQTDAGFAADLLALLDATEPKPVPAGMEERIEAAAQRLQPYFNVLNEQTWASVTDANRAKYRRIAADIARAFGPGLFDGREWIAPWDWQAVAEWVSAAEWRQLRDRYLAYLKEQEKKP